MSDRRRGAGVGGDAGHANDVTTTLHRLVAYTPRGSLRHDRTTDQGDTQVRITVFGKGQVGGGLADLWESAGHQVTRLGRDGGDVSDADVVLVAVPGGSIAEALDLLSGLEGKTVIDATNRIGVRAPEGFASNAEFVKSRTGGPTAKSFNINFASLYGRLGEARVRPSNLWSGDEEAREVVEQLNRDAGYDPVCTGPLENAARQESMIEVIFAIGEGMGDYVYRFAPIEQL
jgi:predicted dinucleotide-binding enzyme